MSKILAISSPGGHWIQLTRLCKELESKHDIVYAMPSSLFKPQSDQTVYAVTDVSADNKWKLIPCAFQVARILWKEKPKAILSTGAAPGFVAIMLGKVFGIKTIWVDSIANVKRLSRAGTMVKKHADVVITQWQHLSDDASNIHYAGSVL